MITNRTRLKTAIRIGLRPTKDTLYRLATIALSEAGPAEREAAVETLCAELDARARR